MTVRQGFFFLFFNLLSATILGVKTPSTQKHTSTLLRGLTMVHTCVVAGCRNRRTPGTTLSFYRFPRDPERKQRWIAAVNREGWVPNDGSRLCSTHFISGNVVQHQTKEHPSVCVDPELINDAALLLRVMCHKEFNISLCYYSKDCLA